SDRTGQGRGRRMTINRAHIVVDPRRAAAVLRKEAAEQVAAASGEVALDFSAVARIDGETVAALEELAALAEQRSVALVLGAVKPDVYRVLKQLGLTRNFVFET